MALGWAHGKTTFFRNDQISQKNFYVGAGVEGGIAATTDTSKAKNNVLALWGGIHVGVNIASVQLIFAAGYGTAVDDKQTLWGKDGAPWVGFGIGLSTFNLSIPAIGSAAGH